MAASLRSLMGSHPDDRPDSATGLTNNQKRLVQSTWFILRGDPIGTGSAVMLAFFKKHPDYQKHFAAFKDVPLDDLRRNKRFQAHCLSVVTALNNIVDSLDDPSLLEAQLFSLGEKHGKRGQTTLQFENLKTVMLEVMAAALGDKFTTQADSAWNSVLGLAYTFIFKGIDATNRR